VNGDNDYAMLIGTEELDTKNKQYPVPDNPHATSSASAPPTFEESARDHVLQFSQDDTFTPAGGEEPPPFVPYDAQFFTSHSGDIISHDSHLNDDGMLSLVFVSSLSELFSRRGPLPFFALTSLNTTHCHLTVQRVP